VIGAGDKRRAGRPRTVDHREVYESIISAAERCISEYGTADVSATQIARAAGTSDKMLKYYFGSKEHLMFLIMKRAQREASEELKEIELTLFHKDKGNPMWRIVRLLASFERKHNACARVFPVRNSKMQEKFYSLLQPTFVHTGLAKILQALIDAGVYSPQLDLRYATFTLGSLLAAPCLLAFALPMHALTPDDLQSDAWITHVASMLDQQFRNPQRLTANLEFESARPGLQ
jgi:AcrR family transcriptional regulator